MSASPLPTATVVKNDVQLYLNYHVRPKETPGSKDVFVELIGTLQHPETKVQIPVKMDSVFSADPKSLSPRHPEVIGMIAAIYKKHIADDPYIRDPRFYSIPDKKGEVPASPDESFTKEGITQEQISRVELGKPLMEYKFTYQFSTDQADSMKWRIDFNGRVKNLVTGTDFPHSLTGHVLKKDCPKDLSEAARIYGMRVLNPISPKDARFPVLLPQFETAETVG